jgi:DNA polymerase
MSEQKSKTAMKYSLASTAGNLGGVYGFLRDDSAATNAMVVFNSSLYSRRKNQIEHCGNKWLLVEGNHPRKTTNNLFCERVALEEELLNCEFDGIRLNLWKPTKYIYEPFGLEKCKECKLHLTARAPVLPSIGKTNVVILGEAPGKEENNMGIGFVGKAGQVLWRELHHYGLSRSLFHVTNVVKCFPGMKKISLVHANMCSTRWLKAELKTVKPMVVLALGNTALHFLKGKDSGIQALNGTTEWDDIWNFWICWCIHPASVLYHPEELKTLKVGIDNFARVLKNLS